MMESKNKNIHIRQSAAWVATIEKLSIIVLFIILAKIGVSQLINALGIQIWPEHMELVDRAVLIGVLLYICLMATPFLPGVEIGLTLMIVLGAKGVLMIYACTIAALIISFLLGKIIPAQYLVSFLQWLHLTRAAVLMDAFSKIPSEKRLDYLAKRTSIKSLPSILKHRYLILAVLLNLPGNALVGGGGGIAMMAGISRLYSFPMYLLVISAAILPIPVFILLSKFQ